MSWQNLFQLHPTQRPDHRFHLVGIGGTGLAPIANVLLEMGFQISGSDQAESERTQTLAQKGALVHIGHDAAHLAGSATPALPDLVLISSAVPDSNPEVEAAHAAQIPVIKRNAFLGPLTAGRQVIAVAGTHGKTTTTGMIAHLLVRAGLEPGYIVGSSIPGLGISAAGTGPYFVIEADEYDYAFWGLHPHIIVLTSLGWDHPDCFPTREIYEDAFRQFVDNLQPGGHVVYCRDDARLKALADGRERANWWGYGSRSSAVWRSQQIEIGPAATVYRLRDPGGAATPVHLAVPGLHNILNSCGALVAANLAGVPIEQAAPLLADFGGAGRRFEVKGEAAGVLVIDDYAHHPTEIRSTLAAARAVHPDRQIWAVYQPHTYSRTRTFLDEFEGIFAAADHVIITDIFAAREAPDPAISPALVAAASHHNDAGAIGDLAAVLDHLRAELRPNSLVIILSAGTATRLGPALLDALATAAGAAARPSLSPALLAALEPFGRHGVQLDAPLAAHSSFRIGGPAQALLTVQDLDDLRGALKALHRHQAPFVMLGGGSNVLISDAGIPGVVILNHCRGIDWHDDGLTVTAESGVALAGFARAALKRGLAGLAWAVSVPGTVGGAVVGNAGTHGGCIADNLISVSLWQNGEVSEITAADLQLGYRRSRLKDEWRQAPPGPVVLSASFGLQPDPEGLELARAERYIDHRRRTQPADKSAGSIFKNPPGDFSGRLIEAAGLKGHSIGGVSVSEQHANFIVNGANSATAAEVIALINHIRRTVFEQFGVILEPEIQFLGDWSTTPTLAPL